MGTRQPRVAFVITSSGAGGAEAQVRLLALELHRRGWDVGVISMIPLEANLSDLGTRGIRTASLGMTRGRPDPRALIRLVRLLQRWRPDVLHGHMVHANLLVRASRVLHRAPVVVSTIHNQDEGSGWRYLAYRLTERLSDVTTAVGADARDAAIQRRAASPSRIIVVRNGVDLGQYEPRPGVRGASRKDLGISDEAFVWLAVGRSVEAKRHVDLITAFAEVHDRRPDAVLLIAGSGPLFDATVAAADAAGLARVVRLLGVRPDVPDLMQAADAFVSSSAWEGLPMVLLEAAASGAPIVATDVGGSRDVVDPSRTGLLVPPLDPPALAAAMDAIMAMRPDDRHAMGEAGRRLVAEAFDLQAVADTWEQVYRDALHARGRTDLDG